ncbi:hypothetical protein KEM60_00830 [Austwickia sp. TVS 96-490-7B]|nr:hypothetical protein [Austwickia sp. TVS 96-490-7B]
MARIIAGCYAFLGVFLAMSGLRDGSDPSATTIALFVVTYVGFVAGLLGVVLRANAGARSAL